MVRYLWRKEKFVEGAEEKLEEEMELVEKVLEDEVFMKGKLVEGVEEEVETGGG